MTEEIRQRLLSMGEEKLRDFSAALTPGAKKIIGVRLPKLRSYAKELAAEWGEDSLKGEDVYFEEVMLRGMIIGSLKIETEKRLALIRDFVPGINNWSVCDSFCVSLRFARKEQERVWDFLQEYLSSEKEFEARFGAVMLLDYFCNETYIDRVLPALVELHCEAYYAAMGAAWAVAECYIKFPEKTEVYLKGKCFDKNVQNRAIQKICDSLRIGEENKNLLRQWKM